MPGNLAVRHHASLQECSVHAFQGNVSIRSVDKGVVFGGYAHGMLAAGDHEVGDVHAGFGLQVTQLSLKCASSREHSCNAVEVPQISFLKGVLTRSQSPPRIAGVPRTELSVRTNF